MNNIPDKATSIYFNELVYELKKRNKEITNLSLGEAFFKLPKITFNGYETDELVHYTSSRGHPRLIDILISHYNLTYKAKLTNNHIMITAGSKIAIFMSIFFSLCGNRKKVAILEPAWLSYHEQIKLSGGKPVFFSYKNNINDILRKINNEYAAIIINNPNNPSGCIICKSELNKLLNLTSKLGIKVIIDEAYSEFIGEDNFTSGSSLIHKFDNLIVINSLSKNLGMSGFRIGYAISNINIINNLVNLNQHLITCAPTILQIYIADNFRKLLNITKPQIIKLILKRRNVIEYAKKIGFSVIESNSTFYIMIKLNLNKKIKVFDFCICLLLKENISVVPGKAYGDSCEEFIRVSVGAASINKIKNALDIIMRRMQKGWDDDDINILLNRNKLPLYK